MGTGGGIFFYRPRNGRNHSPALIMTQKCQESAIEYIQGKYFNEKIQNLKNSYKKHSILYLFLRKYATISDIWIEDFMFIRHINRNLHR